MAGEENNRPTRGNRVVVNVIGKLENGDVVEEFENLELSVGDTEVSSEYTFPKHNPCCPIVTINHFTSYCSHSD